MKRTIVLLTISLIIGLPTFSATHNVKTIKLSYDEKDFIKGYDMNKALILYSTNLNSCFGEDISQPALPFVPVYVAIGSNQVFKSMTFAMEEQLVLSNVQMAHNPEIVATDNPSFPSLFGNVEYAKKLYPEHNINYVGMQVADGCRFLCFNVCPYIYDASDFSLKFVPSFTIDIELAEDVAKTVASKDINRKTSATGTRELLKNMVVNPEDIVFPYDNDENTMGNVSRMSRDVDDVDYVIITSQALAQGFQPLVQWKTRKGVRTQVVTVEDIESDYNESTLPLKIKRCLEYYHNYHGTQYALLGGDDSVVPAEYCYVNVPKYYTWKDSITNQWHTDTLSLIKGTIPTDLFYANFQYPFDWDKNGNDTIGQPEDEVQMFPEIYVTRIPVRTLQHVLSFVNRTLAYEQHPPIENWNDSILTFGSHLYYLGDDVARGDSIYNLYIVPTNWEGNRIRFYETDSDVEPQYSGMIGDNLQYQLEKGYSFVQGITHGLQQKWCTGYYFYNTTHAGSLVNNRPTFISTIACHSNAFDYDAGPCLSEAFLRNDNSNVLTYLGCSREGLSNVFFTISGLGSSDSYDGMYYRKLFSQLVPNKNYGKIVADAKSIFISNSFNKADYRWVMYGLNPMGDSEMPVFVNKPIHFEPMYHDYIGSSLFVNPVSYTPRLCATDDTTLGNNYYQVGYGCCEFPNVDEDIQVCITQPGYKPLLFHYGSIFEVSNCNVFTDNQYLVGEMYFGSYAPGYNGSVVLEEGSKTYVEADIIEIFGEFEVKKGAELYIQNIY